MHIVLEGLVIFLGVHCRGGVKEELYACFAAGRLELKLGPIAAEHQLLVLLADGREWLLPLTREGGVLERACPSQPTRLRRSARSRSVRYISLRIVISLIASHLIACLRFLGSLGRG